MTPEEIDASTTPLRVTRLNSDSLCMNEFPDHHKPIPWSVKEVVQHWKPAMPIESFAAVKTGPRFALYWCKDMRWPPNIKHPEETHNRGPYLLECEDDLDVVVKEVDTVFGEPFSKAFCESEEVVLASGPKIILAKLMKFFVPKETDDLKQRLLCSDTSS